MTIQLPVQNKLELALIAYLWTYGGTIAPELLTDEAGLFDNPGFFAPNPLGLGTVFDAVTWYPGHWKGDMKEVPRIVVTCARAAGDYTSAGYDACDVEVLQRSKSDDDINHGLRHLALRAILTQTMLETIQAATNKPTGADTRAVQGFGLDSLMFRDQIEGRDAEAAQHGTKIQLLATAHLELS
jgi:hypothetical protein